MFGNYNTTIKPRILNPGFTFIELIVVIMLIAILGAIVAPSLRSRKPAYERKQLFDKLEGIINAAQLEAVKKIPYIVFFLILKVIEFV